MSREKYRHEIKYVISENEAVWARNLLENWMTPDPYADSNGVYKVRSLYFDDVCNTAYYEKKEGFYFRKKYRGRIYIRNGAQSAESVKLECKRRTGHKISKKIQSISKDEFSLLTKGKTPSGVAPGSVMEDFVRDSASCKLYPGVIVDYERVPLIDKFYNLRITFDRELNAGWNVNEFFSDNMATIPVFNRHEVILEIKYRDFIPEHIIKVLKNTRMNQQSFSKFFICMNNSYRNVIKELI